MFLVLFQLANDWIRIFLLLLHGSNGLLPLLHPIPLFNCWHQNIGNVQHEVPGGVQLPYMGKLKHETIYQLAQSSLDGESYHVMVPFGIQGHNRPMITSPCVPLEVLLCLLEVCFH